LVVIIVGCLVALGRVANKSALLAIPQAQTAPARQSLATLRPGLADGCSEKMHFGISRLCSIASAGEL
jgi:hypothetical protein